MCSEKIRRFRTQARPQPRGRRSNAWASIALTSSSMERGQQNVTLLTMWHDVAGARREAAPICSIEDFAGCRRPAEPEGSPTSVKAPFSNRRPRPVVPGGASRGPAQSPLALRLRDQMRV